MITGIRQKIDERSVPIPISPKKSTTSMEESFSKKYDLTILSPKELTGKKVSVSSKFMERGAWTKTDTSKHNN